MNNYTPIKQKKYISYNDFKKELTTININYSDFFHTLTCYKKLENLAYNIKDFQSQLGIVRHDSGILDVIKIISYKCFGDACLNGLKTFRMNDLFVKKVLLEDTTEINESNYSKFKLYFGIPTLLQKECDKAYQFSASFKQFNPKYLDKIFPNNNSSLNIDQVKALSTLNMYSLKDKYINCHFQVYLTYLGFPETQIKEDSIEECQHK